MTANKNALIASAVVLVVAVGVLAFVFTNFRSTPSSSPAPSASAPPATAYDEGATRGGDAAPHQRENREHLRPADLTEEATRRLNAEGAQLLPALERIRTSGRITADTVHGALLSAGHETQNVSTASRTLPSDGTTEYVVFGIAFEDGCVSGMVTPTEVDARAAGRVPEWGCLPPDTH